MAKKRLDPIYKSYRSAPELTPTAKPVDTFVKEEVPLSTGGDFLQLGKALESIKPELNAYFAEKKRKEYKERLAKGERLEKEEGKQRIYETFVNDHPEYAGLHPDVIEGYNRSYLRNEARLYRDSYFKNMGEFTVEIDGVQKHLGELTDPKHIDMWTDAVRKDFMKGGYKGIDDVLLSEELFPAMETIERTIQEAMAVQRRADFQNLTKDQFGQNVAGELYHIMDTGVWDNDKESATTYVAGKVQQLTAEMKKAGIPYAEANDTVADTLIQTAAMYNDPELLDIAERIQLAPGSFMGNTPKYRDLFDKARINIIKEQFQKELMEQQKLELHRKQYMQAKLAEYYHRGLREIPRADWDEIIKYGGPDAINYMTAQFRELLSFSTSKMQHSLTAMAYKEKMLLEQKNENGLTGTQQTLLAVAAAISGEESPLSVEWLKHMARTGQISDAVFNSGLTTLAGLSEEAQIPASISARIDQILSKDPTLSRMIGTGQPTDDATSESQVAAYEYMANLKVQLYGWRKSNPKANEEETFKQFLQMHAENVKYLPQRMEAATAAVNKGETSLERINKAGEDANILAKSATPTQKVMQENPEKTISDPLDMNIFQNSARQFFEHVGHYNAVMEELGSGGNTYIGRLAAMANMPPQEYIAEMTQRFGSQLSPYLLQSAGYNDLKYTETVDAVVKQVMNGGWNPKMGGELSDIYLKPLLEYKYLNPRLKPAVEMLDRFLRTGHLDIHDLHDLGLDRVEYNKKVSEILRNGGKDADYMQLAFGAFRDAAMREAKKREELNAIDKRNKAQQKTTNNKKKR